MPKEAIDVSEVRDIDPNIGYARLVDGSDVPLSQINFIGEALIRRAEEDPIEAD